jgi:multiple sugar transport system substrate-binding protein
MGEIVMIRTTKRVLFYSLTGTLIAAAMTSCTNESATEKGKSEPAAVDPVALATKDPVELTVFETSEFPLDEWMEVKGNSIKKKYPNLSFKIVSTSKGTTFADLISSGIKLDLIKVTSTTMYSNVFEHNMQGDISDLIKKYNYDLNQLEPTAVSKLRQIGEGKIYGLPNVVSSAALFYNKDIFDRFGVPYLTDKMTWDEVYEVSKRLTRADGGINYQGFGVTFAIMASTNPFSQPLIDTKTNKAAFNNDNWKKMLTNLSRFHEIPGNPFLASPYAMFFTDQKLAIYAGVSGGSYPDPEKIKFRWDIAAMPTFKELPGVGPGGSFAYYFIPPNSPHRDQAFLALAHLTGEEYSKEYAMTGFLSPNKSKVVRESLGKGMPDLKDRNIKAIVAEKMAEPYDTNQYEQLIATDLSSAFTAVSRGQKDINTALRDAEESANKKIATAIAGK